MHCLQGPRTSEILFAFEAKTHYPGARFSVHVCLGRAPGQCVFVASNPERNSLAVCPYSKDKKNFCISLRFFTQIVKRTYLLLFVTYSLPLQQNENLHILETWQRIMPTLQKIKSLLMTKQMISSSKLVALNS